MIGSAVHLQHLFHLLARQRGLGQHAPDRPLDHALRVFRHHILERREPLVPHVAGVPEIALLLELAPRELHLGRIHDHHAVAAVQMRRERGLVLAAQDLRYLARQPTERLPGRVDQEPAVRHVLFAQAERLHCCSLPRGARSMTAANYTRAVRRCQLEGSGLARVTSATPFSTVCPAVTCTVCTTPARGARSSFSIFIASTTTRPAPASTRCPSATSTRTTMPGIGARTTAGPAPPAAAAATASASRDCSSCTATSIRSPTTPIAHCPSPSSGWVATVHDSPPRSR